MMLHIPEVLSKVQVQRIRAELDTAAAWQNGQLSAGAQAQKIKQNLQFDLQHPSYATLSQDILSALKQQTLLQSFALPFAYPPADVQLLSKHSNLWQSC